MKKLLSIFLLALPTTAIFSQVAIPQEVVADSVAGVDDPVVDASMIAIPEEDYDEYDENIPDGLRSSDRNPIYYYGHNFCTFFLDVSHLSGRGEYAWGLMASYVPEVWGGYLSGHESKDHHWVSAGVEYRLSRPWNPIDWHLYGGIATGDGWGGEVGLRIASGVDLNHSKFCWVGGSMGVRILSGGLFCTMGLNIALSPFLAVFL